MFRKGKHFCMLYHSSSYIIIMILKTAFSLLLKFAMTTMNQKRGGDKNECKHVSRVRNCGCLVDYYHPGNKNSPTDYLYIFLEVCSVLLW